MQGVLKRDQGSCTTHVLFSRDSLDRPHTARRHEITLSSRLSLSQTLALYKRGSNRGCVLLPRGVLLSTDR